MIIEDRLTQAADDARRVVDSFEAPGIQQGMGLRWHRRLAAGVAVAVAIIAVAVAGAWGMADLIANETPPADTAPGPSPTLPTPCTCTASLRLTTASPWPPGPTCGRRPTVNSGGLRPPLRRGCT
jgi:hypothetical protein